VDANDLIDLIRTQLHNTKEEGSTEFNLEQIENWVNSLEGEVEAAEEESSVDTVSSSLKVEEYKLTHQSKLEGYKAETQWSIEQFRSVIAYGQATLKSAILINGGAAVALLAFIGKIWSDENSQLAIKELSYSLTLFVFGTLAIAIATGITYIAQSLFNTGKNTLAHCVNGLVIGLVIASYVLFSLGKNVNYVFLL